MTILIQRIRSMYRFGVSSVAVVMFVAACGSDKGPTGLIPPDQLLHSLEINHPAVNLSTTDPYDTITLRVTARNALGEVLPDTIPVTFTTTGNQIAIFPDGLVRGLVQTSTSGVTVTARATYRGVTLSATSIIVVTNVAVPPVMHSFSFERSISDPVNVGPPVFLGQPIPTIKPIARTSGGTEISRVVFAFQSADQQIAKVSTANGGWKTSTTQVEFTPGVRMAQTFIRAKATVYGVTMIDSVALQVRESDFTTIMIADTLIPMPDSIIIHRGGDVYWMNMSMHDLVGIEFDDPTAVKTATQTSTIALFGAWSPDSGNIAPYIRDTIAMPDHVEFHPSLFKGRSFPTPGTYVWRSTQTPARTGRIVVK